MKTILQFLLIFFYFVFESFSVKSQLTDSIVGLNNSPMQYLIFNKMDIASGNAVNYQHVALGLSSYYSTAINYNTKEYYLCIGETLITVNAITGNVSSTVAIDTNAVFKLLKYNPCDSVLYGIRKVSNTNYKFTKYFPSTGTMSLVSTIPVYPSLGGMSILDPDSGLIIMDCGNSITGIDFHTGAVKYSTTKINISGEQFGHIAYKCSTHEIIGTSANTISAIKYLSKIDPYTGIVSHISTIAWNVGFWKPAGGGCCINQLSGDYFYSGAGGQLIRINTNTGNLISNVIVSNDEMYFIDHFSACPCNSIKVAGEEEVEKEIEIVYISHSKILQINPKFNSRYRLLIYNIESKLQFTNSFDDFQEIDMNKFNSGIYFYEIWSESGQIMRGKISTY